MNRGEKIRMEYIYAALLLHKLGKEINEDNFKKILASVNAEVNESKIKNLIASLKDVDIEKELENAIVMNAGPQNTGSETENQPDKEAPKKDHTEAAAEGLSALFG